MRRFLLAFSAFFLCSSAASAQIAVESLGDYGHWFSQSFVKSGKPVCYMYSVPDKDISSFLVVSETKDDNSVGTVNLEVKSGIKSDNKVIVKVDNKHTFTLVPVGNKAWSDKEDDKIIEAFKKGALAKVMYLTPDGNEVTEIYSLSGFTKAKAAIDKACK